MTRAAQACVGKAKAEMRMDETRKKENEGRKTKRNEERGERKVYGGVVK